MIARRPLMILLLTNAALIMAVAVAARNGDFGQEKKGEEKAGEQKTNDTKKPRVTNVDVEVMGDGKPVDGARVYLKHEAANFAKESTTNRNGIASFSKVPLGKIKIEISEVTGYPAHVSEEAVPDKD